MTTTKLDQIGAEAARLLKTAKQQNTASLTKANDVLAQRHKKIKPMLEQVWAAFDAGQTVNGFKTKGAWAKAVGYTTRALQHIIYGRPDRKVANRGSHVVTLKTGMLVKISDVTYRIPEGTNHPVHSMKKNKQQGTFDVTLRGLVMVDNGSPKEEKKPAPKDSGAPNSEEPVTKTGRRRKAMYLKNFRNVKRIAKFFNEMALELKDGMDGDYAKLREIYPADGGDGQYPWAVPMEGYVLPDTEEEFEQQDAQAFRHFQSVAAEGIDKGWMVKKDITPIEESKPAKKNKGTQPTTNVKLQRIKLTKAQKEEVEHLLSGSFIEDDDGVRERLEEFRNGMDDAAFDQWIQENYIDAISLNGNSLVLEPLSPCYKVIIEHLKNEFDWVGEEHYQTAYLLSSNKEEKAQARGGFKTAQNLSQKLKAAQ